MRRSLCMKTNISLKLIINENVLNLSLNTKAHNCQKQNADIKLHTIKEQ